MGSAMTVTYDAGNYGTVVLLHPTVTISSVNVLSQSGGFTALIRKTYTIRAILTETNEYGLTALMAQAQATLGTNRGTCTITDISGQSTIIASPVTDIDKGPVSQVLEVTKIYGSCTAMIAWQLETHLLPIPINGNASAAIWAFIDFVYTIQTSLDQKFYQVRTISGVLRFAANHPSTYAFTADAFRDTVEANIAPIPTLGAWQRTQRSYQLSEDAQALAFTIVDTQQYTFLPPGVLDGDIVLRCSSFEGAKGSYALHGWFEGSPSQTRPAMLMIAAWIFQTFYQRVLMLISQDTGGGTNAWLIQQKNVEYTCYYRSNRIEFAAEWAVDGQLVEQYSTDPNILLGSIPINGLYVAARALDWLASLSIDYWQSRTDEGAYSNIPVMGLSGTDQMAPLLSLDVSGRYPVFPPTSGSGGDNTAATNQSTGIESNRNTVKYISWEQHYAYKVISHWAYIPVQQLGVNPIRQRTQNDEMFITVSGVAIAQGGLPRLPCPPYKSALDADLTGSQQGTAYLDVVSEEVVPYAPTPNGLYKLTWETIYRIANPMTSTSGMHLPYSPMVATPPGLSTWIVNTQMSDTPYLPLPTDVEIGQR